MTVDRYTKVVLTVIAACLIWLSVGGPSLVSSVSAQTSGYERVLLAGWIDQAGVERPLPAYPPTATGKPARPAPLPVWDAVAQRNP